MQTLLRMCFTVLYEFHYRHHVYKKVDGGRDIELQEVGPRFEMKGTTSQFPLEQKHMTL